MLVIKNAQINFHENEMQKRDILISDGFIQKIEEHISPEEGWQVIDAGEKALLPGLIDVHVHLREPGFEQKGTIFSETNAAAAGGYTAVMPMPNLRPVPDSSEIMREYCQLLNKESVVRIFPYASITYGEKGEKVVEVEKLISSGASAFSDDGVGVQSEAIMKEAMKKIAATGRILAAHTEDDRLNNHGYVHDGAYAKENGWRGIPSASEYEQIRRDLLLVRETNCRYHVCHVSAKESVELIRKAKGEGLPVTAEVTPHHLLLCDEDVKDANDKMNPPLREKSDQEALLEGILDGTIDVIATDHAPHGVEEKRKGLEEAPFGIVGLETAFPLLYTHLVCEGKLSLEQLIQLMSKNPGQAFGMHKTGQIKEGYAANLVLIDLITEKKVDENRFLSKGRNTPFSGWQLKGWPVWTMMEGKVIYSSEIF